MIADGKSLIQNKLAQRRVVLYLYRFLEANRSYRGRSIDVRGKYLQDILKDLKRQVLDVDVEVAFNRRAYRGKEKKDNERFRLVAVYNEDEDKYHLYITNLSQDLL